MPRQQAQTSIIALALLSALSVTSCAGTRPNASDQARRGPNFGPEVADGITVYGQLSASISHVDVEH